MDQNYLEYLELTPGKLYFGINTSNGEWIADERDPRFTTANATLNGKDILKISKQDILLATAKAIRYQQRINEAVANLKELAKQAL